MHGMLKDHPFAPQTIKSLRGLDLERIGRDQQRLHGEQSLIFGHGRLKIAGLLERLTKTPMSFPLARRFRIDDEKAFQSPDRVFVPPFLLRRDGSIPEPVFGFHGRTRRSRRGTGRRGRGASRPKTSSRQTRQDGQWKTSQTINPRERKEAYPTSSISGKK